MPDTRLPERWLLDVALVELSPSAWQFFTTALMYCNAQGTDGFVREGAFRFLPRAPSDQDLAAVVATGRLERVEGGYQFRDWTGELGQSSAAAIEIKREQNRTRQQTYRDRHKRAVKGARGTRDVTEAVARDVTRDVQGEDRQGEDRRGEGSDMKSRASRKAPAWPVAAPGSGRAFPLEPYDGTNATETRRPA
jgi:hypothetical protein